MTDQPLWRVGDLPIDAVERVWTVLRDESVDAEESESDDLPRLPGYSLVRRLGEGGGGAVYLGYRDGSDRPLAVKILGRRIGAARGSRGGGQGAPEGPPADEPAPPEPSPRSKESPRSGESPRPGPLDTDRRRAWRELELLMSLRLHCVPRVIDYGVQRGRLFIATEYVEGRPLDEYCRPLALREKVEVLARVADAVQSLHEHGVIHRDLKPSNILVIPGEGAAPPQVMIIDLGIATLLARDAMETLTADGAPIGSPAFMAPEQARGERDKISTRTDVYGLGATAYHVLTGQGPFDCSGTVHGVLQRIGTTEPRPVRQLEPRLPSGLMLVLEKTVAACPETRYESASALASDMKRWLSGELVSAQPLGCWHRAARWAGRHPALSTALAFSMAVGGLMGGTGLAMLWMAGRPASIREFVGTNGRPRIEILSATGHVLRHWEQPAGSTAFASVVDGAGRIFLVSSNDPQDKFAGQLCAYTGSDVEHPAWVSGSGPPDFQMPELAGFTAPQRYVLARAQLVEVFAENEGPEVLAIFHHRTWSPTVLRIYDPGGRVLFEAWNNGYIHEAAWMPEVGVLGLAALNSETRWPGRIGASGVKKVFPTVTMGLRPQFGTRAGWIGTPDTPGDLQPLWYRCVLPADALDTILPTRDAGAGDATGTSFRLWLNCLSFTIDGKTGEAVRHIDTNYYRLPQAPDPLSIVLGDLPPVRPDAPADLRPANN